MTADRQSSDYLYDVALSFAGEDREYVGEVAAFLKANGVRTFFDDYERTELWGKDLYTHLDDVYRNQARYCVMFLSSHYKEKVWTNHERQSAQTRAFQESTEYVLPARFDDTEIPGITPTVGYVDLRNMRPAKFGQLILDKLALFPAHGGNDYRVLLFDRVNPIRTKIHPGLSMHGEIHCGPVETSVEAETPRRLIAMLPVLGTEVVGGSIVLSVFLGDLLCAKESDLVSAYVKEAEDHAANTPEFGFLRDLFRAEGQYTKDIATLRRELKARESLLSSILLYSVCGDQGAAKACLKSVTDRMRNGSDGTPYIEGILDCARAWHYIDSGESHVLTCLLAATEAAGASSEYSSFFEVRCCAEHWIFLLDRESEAIDCVKSLEGRAEDVDHWVTCAGLWNKMGRISETLDCLVKAEDLATDLSDFLACGAAWREQMAEDNAARRCLEAAQNRAEGGFHLVDCPEAWWNVLGDRSMAIKSLESAEANCRDRKDIAKCAHQWVDLLGDKTRGEDCLKKATERAGGWTDDSPYYVFECVDAWLELFDDKFEAKRALKSGEQVASSAYNIQEFVEKWIDTFGDRKEARRCLEEFEARCGENLDHGDWTGLSEIWKDQMNDRSNSKRCAKMAKKSLDSW